MKSYHISIGIFVAICLIVSASAQSHNLYVGGCNGDNNSELLYSEVLNVKNDSPRRWYNPSNWFAGSPPPKKVINATFVYPPNVSEKHAWIRFDRTWDINSFHQMQQVSPNQRTICGIQVIDKATDGSGGHPKITGLGQTWVSIFFVSQPGGNICFNISIYGPKHSAPLNAAPPSPIQPPNWNPHYAGPPLPSQPIGPPPAHPPYRHF